MQAPKRLVHGLLGLVVGMLYRLARFVRLFVRPRSLDPTFGAEVLLTGTFDSIEWVKAFIHPIAAADRCRNVVLVTTLLVPEDEGITVVNPASWLRRLVGDVPSRLLTFLWQSLRRRPFLVGGFHISINALVADLAAAIAGARSMYVCVGGPIEIIDGGLWGESRFFSRLREADPDIERKLLRTVRQMDVIVPMGQKAAVFFEEHGVRAERIHVMTGGVDAARFRREKVARDVDLLFLGRLVPIKGLELLLETVHILTQRRHRLRCRIVGRGPMEEEMKQLTVDLGIEKSIEFAGFVPDVVDELVRAKCFVLTSHSEGLSLAMIEAMLAGAIPVVADVGDLGDLVENGLNGFLIASRDPADFASAIDRLLDDEHALSAFSEAAYTTALRCDIGRVAEEWDALLCSLGSPGD